MSMIPLIFSAWAIVSAISYSLYKRVGREQFLWIVVVTVLLTSLGLPVRARVESLGWRKPSWGRMISLTPVEGTQEVFVTSIEFFQLSLFASEEFYQPVLSFYFLACLLNLLWVSLPVWLILCVKVKLSDTEEADPD